VLSSSGKSPFYKKGKEEVKGINKSMGFLYNASGHLFTSGSALFVYEAGGSLGLGGVASEHIESSAWVVAGSGSLSGMGLSTSRVTGTTQPGGRMTFRGYATITLFANPVPIPVTPIRLGGRPLPKTPPVKLVRAYDREAVLNGFWDPSNSAFIPIGTAANYTVINRRTVQPGTGVEPHYNLIVSEN